MSKTLLNFLNALILTQRKKKFPHLSERNCEKIKVDCVAYITEFHTWEASVRIIVRYLFFLHGAANCANRRTWHFSLVRNAVRVSSSRSQRSRLKLATQTLSAPTLKTRFECTALRRWQVTLKSRRCGLQLTLAPAAVFKGEGSGRMPTDAWHSPTKNCIRIWNFKKKRYRKDTGEHLVAD